MPADFFILDNRGNYVPVKNGKNPVKNIMGITLGGAVASAYGLMGGAAYIAYVTPDLAFSQAIFDAIHTVSVMTVGAFLALAKDIFIPRREIQIEDILELADKIGKSDLGQKDNSTIQNGNERRVI